ncbi:ribonuclease E/G [Amaricoccus solimangrovi]|uniref:Ribonuclease G n=1 Tax=Amaricoccus solimangrovi TaxID=2589815 RepID=A0A501WMN0_9RHOB|nr:ribonuclease E/G [Amaricoccus solimangrovi]TPE50699.1 ribonuclease G [Amaricoccus solimangrovi]
MKGREVRVEALARGGHIAALAVDGRLEDLLIDPDPADPTPRPEAIFRAVAGRPMKGIGGVMLELGRNRTGFLRTPRPPRPGAGVIVQVSAWAEDGKAPPVSDRPLVKGRAAILTPGAPGHNIARSLRDPERRAALAALAETAMRGAPEGLGLILRSAAGDLADAAIAAEIAALRAEAERLTPEGPGGELRPAPGAAAEAAREWLAPGEKMVEGLGDLWDAVAALADPRAPIGAGFMAIEPTRALVAVDVNTGGDTSPAAALKANLAAARDLPRQLRLRGLGGQVTIDFAPLAKAERAQVEKALNAALRADGIDTTLAGWTPLGHLELLRRRSRRPIGAIPEGAGAGRGRGAEMSRRA